uniref:NSFL1 cofactor p47 n=1 Tax=Timema tahoe TaxID=61484 RepID=A0A7R9INL0_9NEOP|nr:unnamed protein product [Timema tahoe]
MYNINYEETELAEYVKRSQVLRPSTNTRSACFDSNIIVQVALASFYENDGDDNPIIVEDTEPEGQAAPPPSPVPVLTDSHQKQKPKPKQPAGYSSRIATVAGLNSDTSDEEEGQAFYAGGSEHSGQQVLGPSKKKDIVSEMFKSVKEHGAEVVDTHSPRGPGPSSSFAGTGYRLGQSTNDSEVIGPPSGGRRDSHTEVVLKLWKEGFSINNGPLKRYSDPENRGFLDSVRRGEIPTELVRESHGSEVHLNMEDHRHEDFVTPKNKLNAFGGKGHVLGRLSPRVRQVPVGARSSSPGNQVRCPYKDSLTVRQAIKCKPCGRLLTRIFLLMPLSDSSAPATVGAVTMQSIVDSYIPPDASFRYPAPATVGAVKPADEKDRTANEEQAKDSLNVDKALPTTTIQIRLADGSRLIGQFNHTHTIGDVRSYITIARPQYQNQNFSLLTTFPSKELSDNSVTLSDAGILNAAVMQRLT